MAILAPYAENPIRDPGPYRRGGSGGGVRQKFFTLLEDVESAGLVRVYAVPSSETGVKSGSVTKVTSWMGIINGALAGYTALFSRVDGQWVFAQGPCLTPCTTDGEILL